MLLVYIDNTLSALRLPPLEAAITRLYHSNIDGSKPQLKFNYGKRDYVGALLYLDEHPIRGDGDSACEILKRLLYRSV